MSSVDVIIPCYRYGHFLRECVQSVLTQPISCVRVLIIDDASPDNTADVGAELAKQDSRVTFSRHITNKGHIATYNEGLEWASADYLLLLSADDYLVPGALKRSADLMDAYPEVGFVFGSAVELHDNGTTRKVAPPIVISDETRERILSGSEFVEVSGSRNIVPTPTAVVRTNLQHRLGGYHPELPHTGDMEMWLRLATHASVGVLAACQAAYRRHGSNMSLAYMGKNSLSDLQQRKAALDCFVQTSKYAWTDARFHYRKMLLSLGRDAIGFASEAFNEGLMDISQQLSHFALSISPDIKRTVPWAKLACKRRLGLRGWRALQAILGVSLQR